MARIDPDGAHTFFALSTPCGCECECDEQVLAEILFVITAYNDYVIPTSGLTIVDGQWVGYYVLGFGYFHDGYGGSSNIVDPDRFTIPVDEQFSVAWSGGSAQTITYHADGLAGDDSIDEGPNGGAGPGWYSGSIGAGTIYVGSVPGTPTSTGSLEGEEGLTYICLDRFAIGVNYLVE